ncbi:hypothetical protein UTI89_C5142 [Escherichia coli UTI89]|uniref:Uncharacterized protein n=1 Tax=Escherichia coli (strain UTI89 / UPEC) TaxID=364106 RepID=Q1R272_ECOUT|nr:hypothetical protein UTI89_C5142 [Escherichia coli UTI89]
MNHVYKKPVLRRLSISGFYSSGAAASLRIFFVPSSLGRCSAETANFLFLLVLYWHCPIMNGGLAGVETAGTSYARTCCGWLVNFR